ncbi:MAG TPA: hypothetical protein VJ934_03830 [Desulfomicrobiaceae bacterium]|nr:hypothetical protein [Desulfomicrobiaceae bacterium]
MLQAAQHFPPDKPGSHQKFPVAVDGSTGRFPDRVEHFPGRIKFKIGILYKGNEIKNRRISQFPGPLQNLIQAVAVPELDLEISINTGNPFFHLMPDRPACS